MSALGPDVIFVGPSLSHDEARAILPDAVILPPAAMGDVLGAWNRFRPRAIGIIDGTFLTNMSVYHKEILYAIDRGAWVLGASSMGALRAAECHQYGMIGVGSIFDRLVSGDIEDDDEVALTHAEASDGYRALSDAYVTIEATIRAAQTAGVISPSEATALLEVQKNRYFPDRRLSSVAADAREIGIADERATALRDWIRANPVDPKRQDAIALLERIRDLPVERCPEDMRPGLMMSGVFSATLSRDVYVDHDRAPALTLDRIRRYAALHSPDYDAALSRAKRNHALMQVSYVLGGPATPEEFARGRARLAERAGVPVEEFDAWLVSQDVDEHVGMAWIAAEAMLLRMEDSWLGRTRHGAISNLVLHELRLDGHYEDIKGGAALQYMAAEDVVFDPEPDAETILASFLGVTGFHPRMSWPEYVDLHEHQSMAELIIAMDVSVRAHHSLFGTGLASGDHQIITLDDGPMSSRGR